MARILLCLLGNVAILIALFDDSIALSTTNPDDVLTAALDNEYITEQPENCQLSGRNFQPLAAISKATHRHSFVSRLIATPVEPPTPLGTPNQLLLMSMQC